MIISPASPPVLFGSFATTGAIGVSMTAGDKVTSMGGAFNPNGTVTFTLYSDLTCTPPPS